MDPFVLSRNAFNIYCSQYAQANSSVAWLNNNNHPANTNIEYPPERSNINLIHPNDDYQKTVDRLNQRYEHFLQTLDRLRMSVEHSAKDQNVNSVSKREFDTLTRSSTASRRSDRKRMSKAGRRRMPRVHIAVSCAEHQTRQQPNVTVR